MIVPVSDFKITDYVFRNNTKTREEKRAGGTISNWTLCSFTRGGNPEPVCYFLIGSVDGDTVFGYEPNLTTSAIVNLDLEAGEVETFNTVYKLGPVSDYYNEEHS
jgi:hypothetical protein